jgi:hypothetical protein
MRRSRLICASISPSLRLASVRQRIAGGVVAENPATNVRVSAMVKPASRATWRRRNRPITSAPYRR